MTEQIKSAIEELKGFYMNDSCHEDFNECICYECKEHCEDGKPIILAIRSLQAWDEVLQELEGQADFANSCGDTEEELGIKGAIETIKQKLADIEE